MAHDVFISYSVKDKSVADAVCASLEADGLTCWIAPRDIRPGADWSGSIVKAISETRVMVLIFSANANVSPPIRAEVEQAFKRELAIIPFRIENIVPAPSLEFFLSTPHWRNAFTGAMEENLAELAKDVRNLLGRPVDVPAAHAPAGGGSPEQWLDRAVDELLLDAPFDAVKEIVARALAAGTAPRAAIRHLAKGVAIAAKGQFHTPETMPANMKKNATEHYAGLARDKEIYLYYDNSGTGTAKSGFAIFDGGISWRNSFLGFWAGAQTLSFLSTDLAEATWIRKWEENDRIHIGPRSLHMMLGPVMHRAAVACLLRVIHWLATVPESR